MCTGGSRLIAHASLVHCDHCDHCADGKLGVEGKRCPAAARRRLNRLKHRFSPQPPQSKSIAPAPMPLAVLPTCFRPCRTCHSSLGDLLDQQPFVDNSQQHASAGLQGPVKLRMWLRLVVPGVAWHVRPPLPRWVERPTPGHLHNGLQREWLRIASLCLGDFGKLRYRAHPQDFLRAALARPAANRSVTDIRTGETKAIRRRKRCDFQSQC